MASKIDPIPRRLSLSDLEADPRNPNVVSEETLAKIERNIRQTGLTPPILVRPHKKGKIEPPFIIIDGHHRKIILERMGATEHNCEIWDVTERQAQLMLLTLNRLHGEDNVQKRADLIAELRVTIPEIELPQILPESAAEIEDLMRVRQVDLDALERAQRETAERNEAETPRSWSVVLFPAQIAKLEAALDHIIQTAELEKTKNAKGQALEYLAAEYLAGAVYEEAEAAAAQGRAPHGSGPQVDLGGEPTPGS